VRFLALLVCGIPLHAAFCSASDGASRHEFEFFAGYSPVSSTLIGTETGRRFVAAGFIYAYRCWIWKSASLSYSPTLLPAAILLQPSETLYNFYPPYQRVSPPHAVYGFAIAPLGFTLDLWRARRFHPFAESIGGLIASTEPIPENQPDASGLNFLFDFGAGLRWNARPRQVVTLGYRFLHISNAATTSFNPGVDNNIFYLGYSFLR
jgi:Lipid A 3-O-deacylase (PagL)